MVERRQVVSTAIAVTALSVAVGAQLLKKTPVAPEPVLVTPLVSQPDLATSIDQAMKMAALLEAFKRATTGDQESKLPLGKDGLPIFPGYNQPTSPALNRGSNVIISGSYSGTVVNSGTARSATISGVTVTHTYEP